MMSLSAIENEDEANAVEKVNIPLCMIRLKLG